MTETDNPEIQMRWDFDGSTVRDRALFEELKAKGLIQEKEVLEYIQQLDTSNKIIVWDSL